MNGTPSPQTSVSEEFVTEKLPVGWPWRLLVFSIIIFALTLFIYLGIKFGYTSYLEGTSADLDKSLEALGNEVSVADQQQFVNFYSQIVNLKSALDQHLLSANLFSLLEQNVIGGVVFTEARFKAADETLELQGTASSFDILAQQMGMFEKVRGVDHVLLEDVSVAGGGATFKLAVFLTDEYLKKFITP
jgi:hypothetical protein